MNFIKFYHLLIQGNRIAIPMSESSSIDQFQLLIIRNCQWKRKICCNELSPFIWISQTEKARIGEQENWERFLLGFNRDMMVEVSTFISLMGRHCTPPLCLGAKQVPIWMDLCFPKGAQLPCLHDPSGCHLQRLHGGRRGRWHWWGKLRSLLGLEGISALMKNDAEWGGRERRGRGCSFCWWKSPEKVELSLALTARRQLVRWSLRKSILGTCLGSHPASLAAGYHSPAAPRAWEWPPEGPAGSRGPGDASSAAGSCHINKAPELCRTQPAPCQPDNAPALCSLMMDLLSEAPSTSEA